MPNQEARDANREAWERSVIERLDRIIELLTPSPKAVRTDWVDGYIEPEHWVVARNEPDA